MRSLLMLSAVLLALLGGCSIAPTHPSLKDRDLPPLIPVRDFVANREGSGTYRVSPDGRKLAWVGVSGVSPAVWVKSLDRDDAKAFLVRSRGLVWSGDSRYLAITVDRRGDEDTHVMAGTVEGGSTELVDLTPFDGTRSNVARTIEDSSAFVISSNLRDKKVFDLYRIDAVTGERSLIARNPGNVGGWAVDRDGRVMARFAVQDESTLMQVPEGDAWITRATISQRDSIRLADFATDGRSAWALSNRGRDKLALVRLDLATGAEQMVYEDPEVDVDQVLMSRKSRTPLMAHSMPGYPRQEVFDAALRARLAPLSGGQPVAIHVNSIDSDERVMTVSLTTDKGTQSYLLAGDAPPELLGKSNIGLLSDSLGSTRPIRYMARDGLPIHGYLTLPPGEPAGRLPMVLLVHGGPWARDTWTAIGTNRSPQQFLANRGYAVLQVNYRGSRGYGRDFMEKAVGEFAGKMHDDLIDGVRWAVAQGVADPARVAIYGASYGGYSALVGATMTPDTFACAVDLVGMSDLSRLIANAPAYWALGLPWWKRYVGDPADPAQRKIMDAKSPINHVDNVQAPLLIMHGVNDPRVKFDQSERMVAALRAAGKKVEFVSFQDDGHGNQKWSNNLAMYRHAEDFLAGCLGGRSSGFDYYQLGAWAF